MKFFDLLSELLNNRKTLISYSLEKNVNKDSIFTLVLLSIIFFSIYGFIIGSSHSFLQAISAAIKLPILFYLTMAICFPTLYFFLTVLEAKLKVGQLFGFIVLCLTIMSISLIAFAPISVFFLLTSDSYGFYKLVNIAIFGVSGFIGVYFFYKNLSEKLSSIEDIMSRKRALLFLKIWLFMFAIIGSQLSYSLSPFFGFPEVTELMIFPNAQKSFFVDLLETLRNI